MLFETLCKNAGGLPVGSLVKRADLPVCEVYDEEYLKEVAVDCESQHGTFHRAGKMEFVCEFPGGGAEASQKFCDEQVGNGEGEDEDEGEEEEKEEDHGDEDKSDALLGGLLGLALPV